MILGLDGSYAAFGVSIIDIANSNIILDQLDQQHNSPKFYMTSWQVANMYNELLKNYKQYINFGTLIGIEAPPASSMASKLWSLDTYFYLKLGELSDFSHINSFHVSKFRRFHGRKYTKKDTIDVVENILKIFEKYNYTIEIKRSRLKKTLCITDGEADSFLYAVSLFVSHYGLQHSDIVKDILTMYPNITLIEPDEIHGNK